MIGAAAFVATIGAHATTKKHTKQACVAAYKEGQVHRKNGELLLARDDFAICADQTCPQVLRRDCAPWLAKVQASIPTIVVNVSSGSGKSISDFRMLLDGKAVEKAGAGGEIEMDPGAHVVRVDAPGHQPVERSVKVRSGEKKTVVDIELEPVVAAVAPVVVKSRPIPASAIAFTVVGLAGVGAFAGFGLHGNELKRDLESCKPACAPARVDEVKRDYIIADAALGVGVVFLGLATWSFLTRPEVPKQTATWRVHVAPGQTLVTLSGSF